MTTSHGKTSKAGFLCCAFNRVEAANVEWYPPGGWGWGEQLPPAPCYLKPLQQGLECVFFRAEPRERGTQGLRWLKGSREEREAVSIYQDVLHGWARAGSCESPYRTGCTVTTPELMLSREQFNGITWEESWQFCSFPARKSIFT